MKHYDVIILLTFHESKDSLFDNIRNFKRYMPNALILISNALGMHGEELSELNDDANVLVLQRKAVKIGLGMLPVHHEMLDYIKSNNLTSEYILPLSSNQLFVREGFYEFMKRYPGGIHQMPFHDEHKERVRSASPKLVRHMEMIGMEHFLYHTNHDSMFFLFDDFVEMLSLLEEYRIEDWTGKIDLEEEFLYSAYLVKKYGDSNLAKFKDYSYWNHSKSYRDMEDLQDCMNKGHYLIKRVIREYDDPVRTAIRNMGQY